MCILDVTVKSPANKLDRPLPSAGSETSPSTNKAAAAEGGRGRVEGEVPHPAPDRRADQAAARRRCRRAPRGRAQEGSGSTHSSRRMPEGAAHRARHHPSFAPRDWATRWQRERNASSAAHSVTEGELDSLDRLSVARALTPDLSREATLHLTFNRDDQRGALPPGATGTPQLTHQGTWSRITDSGQNRCVKIRVRQPIQRSCLGRTSSMANAHTSPGPCAIRRAKKKERTRAQ